MKTSLIVASKPSLDQTHRSVFLVSEAKQWEDTETPTSDRPQPALKRRHARPHELDSDEDNGQEEDDIQLMSDKVDATVLLDDAPQIQVKMDFA